MSVVYSVSFKMPSALSGDYTKHPAIQALAQSIPQEPGFLSKIWTENPQTGQAGGIYIFRDQASADAYAAMHEGRLREFGITQIDSAMWQVQAELTALTQGICALVDAKSSS